jgi:hypothetical protein
MEQSTPLGSERSRPLAQLSDDALLRSLCELVGESRRIESRLVELIAEVDERKLYAREAMPSMFAYCTDVLHLSEAEAYLRISVARASRKHPVLLDLLRDGRLHLTGIATLRPFLTAENREVLLARAVHRSKRQIEELVAEIAPRPDVATVMRRLPERKGIAWPGLECASGREQPLRAWLDGGTAAVAANEESAAGRSGAAGQHSAAGRDLVVGRDVVADPELRPGRATREESALRPERAGSGGPEAEVAVGERRSVVEALAPGRHKVQFTASSELREKLERLRSLLRPEIPDGDLAAVIERAVTEKLASMEARRFAATSRPRKGLSTTDMSPASRRIPAAVRRAVSERDGLRCGFVDETGRRCSERERLEYHHRHPFGLGGDHSPANIGLLCRAHNLWMAEHDYGRAAMARHRGSTRTAAATRGSPRDDVINP